MQGLLFPYSCTASHSGFSHYWGFKTIAAAIVGSRLDFCNSLWLALPFQSASPSACPEHSCSGMLHKNLGSATSHRFLSDLHWLPVRQRIALKSLRLLSKQGATIQQLSYLASLIPQYVPARALRSSSSLSICVPTRETTMAASKSFSSVASGIWMHCRIICRPS